MSSDIYGHSPDEDTSGCDTTCESCGEGYIYSEVNRTWYEQDYCQSCLAEAIYNDITEPVRAALKELIK